MHRGVSIPCIQRHSLCIFQMENCTHWTLLPTFPSPDNHHSIFCLCEDDLCGTPYKWNPTFIIFWLLILLSPQCPQESPCVACLDCLPITLSDTPLDGQATFCLSIHLWVNKNSLNCSLLKIMPCYMWYVNIYLNFCFQVFFLFFCFFLQGGETNQFHNRTSYPSPATEIH